MSMTCRTCRHPKREEIDRALAEGESSRRIAALYGLAETSVRRHGKLHMRPALARQAQKLDVHEKSILSGVLSLHARTLALLAQAEEAGDLRSAIAAVREARGNLELTGRATGELLPPQLQQVYISLGISDETELRRIIEQHKALDTFSLDDAERDAVEALKLVFAERPERKTAILAELSSGAVELESEGADVWTGE